MEKVNDLEVYVRRMERSLMDKLFFMPMVGDRVDTVLDFGCANGVLIAAMRRHWPRHSFIGYDISPEMIRLAREALPGCAFYERWEEIPFDPEKTLINISSTVHEVYSYGTEASVAEFWSRVFGSGFRYIAIRDMMLSEKSLTPSDPADVEKARKLFPEKLAEYEGVWGSIDSRRDLIHYLLKYSYTENWEREVRENYLPITVEHMLSLIPEDYEVVLYEHRVLPYIRGKVLEDCGIDLTDGTHLKLLLRKKTDEC